MSAVVQVVASDKEDPNDGTARVWFDGDVLLGDTFGMDSSLEGEDHFPAHSYLHVTALDGTPLMEVEFHTSCSQPLCAGNQFGSHQVRGCLGEHEDDSGDPYCTIDDVSECACGNDPPNAGCENSTGGRLQIFGSASVFTDDLSLITSQLPANQSAVAVRNYNLSNALSVTFLP
ncbi:MAG: hypothetical protein ACI841_001241 [Planctomycetota bacterium]|jgi:hypothetical protein